MAATSLSPLHFNPFSTAVKPSNYNSPMLLVSMANPTPKSNPSYWTCLNIEIDTHLKQAIPIKPPLLVYEPMRHLTFAAPQSSAPALCIAACELVGGRREHALAAAAALRLMLAAAFTHENLPLTGDPHPNSAHRFGPNLELLTPDGMIPFGFELLAQLDDRTQNYSGRVLRVITEISNAMGSQGMIEGQYNELEYGKSRPGGGLVDSRWLNEVCRKKEGRIHACSGACGAILGGGNEDEIEKMRRFGVYVGMIQGVLKKAKETKIKEECYLKEVNELRESALMELKHFNQHNIGVISTLLDTEF